MYKKKYPLCKKKSPAKRVFGELKYTTTFLGCGWLMMKGYRVKNFIHLIPQQQKGKAPDRLETLFVVWYLTRCDSSILYGILYKGCGYAS